MTREPIDLEPIRELVLRASEQDAIAMSASLPSFPLRFDSADDRAKARARRDTALRELGGYAGALVAEIDSLRARVADSGDAVNELDGPGNGPHLAQDASGGVAAPSDGTTTLIALAVASLLPVPEATEVEARVRRQIVADIEALAAERDRVRHRPGSVYAERQRGERVAFAFARDIANDALDVRKPTPEYRRAHGWDRSPLNGPHGTGAVLIDDGGYRVEAPKGTPMVAEFPNGSRIYGVSNGDGTWNTADGLGAADV